MPIHDPSTITAVIDFAPHTKAAIAAALVAFVAVTTARRNHAQ